MVPKVPRYTWKKVTPPDSSSPLVGGKIADSLKNIAINRATTMAVDEGYNAITDTDQGLPDPLKDYATDFIKVKFNLTDDQAKVLHKMMPGLWDLAGKAARTRMDMGDVVDFKKAKKAIEKATADGPQPNVTKNLGKISKEMMAENNARAMKEARLEGKKALNISGKPESSSLRAVAPVSTDDIPMLDKLRSRLDGGAEHKATRNWIDHVEKNGSNEPYIGLDLHNNTALRGPSPGDPIHPIPVPIEKIGDLGGVLGKGVLKGESDPFGWMDTKYGVSKSLLEREADKPLKIYTRSDLIAHDDYASLLNPKKHEVNIVIPGVNNGINRLLEPGAPSLSRRIKAANKLMNEGIQVNFIYQSYTNPNLPKVLEQTDRLTIMRELRSMGLDKDIGIESVSQSISDEAVARLRKILGDDK